MRTSQESAATSARARSPRSAQRSCFRPPRRIGSSGLTRPSDAVSESLRLGQRLELLERVVLDLPDPLAGDAERAPDLLERRRLLAREPEAELDHLALALRQRRERQLDVLAP